MRLTYDTRTTDAGRLWPDRHYHPSSAVELDGTTYVLGAGTSDDVVIVQDRDTGYHYVVTQNATVDYAIVGALRPDGDEVTCETVEGHFPTGDKVTAVREEHIATADELNACELSPITLVRRYVRRHVARG